MANKERYSVEEVTAALRESRGLRAPAARALGLSYNGLKNYEKRHSSIRRVLEEEREKFLDAAEIALHRLVADLHPPAVFFVLRTLGRHRGYTEQVEVHGRHRHSGDPKGEPIRIVRIVPAPTREQLMNGSGSRTAEREG